MVQIANPAGNFPTLNGSLPCEGTKAFPFNLDFTASNGYQIDLTSQYQQKQFTTLQTVWIDNSQNADSFTLICGATSQTVIAAPFTQGFYALLQPNPPKFVVESNGNLVMQIILLNYYVPPFVWNITQVSAGGLPQIDIPALDAIISGGAINTNMVPFTETALIDGSGAIAVGGTTQVALVANAGRKYISLSNPDTATETLYYCWGVIGAGKIALLPGASYESGSVCVGDELFVLGATTGHAFTLYSK